MINVNRVRAMIYRYMVTWGREFEEVLDAFWWPSFDILLWGFMTVYLQSKEGVPDYFTGFIIGSIILWMFVYRSQQEISVLFLREFWQHNLLNIFTSPVTITEYMISTVCVGILKLTISGLWMGLLSYLIFHFSLFSFGWYFIPLVLNLFIVGWWSGFIVMGLIVQYGHRVQSFAWSLIVIIQPFSCVFYPKSVLPMWMQQVSNFLPTSYIFENMRQVLSTGTMDMQNLYIATGLNVVYLVLSLLFFQWGFTRAKRNGMIMKFS